MGCVGGVAEKWSPVIAIVVANVAAVSANALVKISLDVGVNHMVVGSYRLAISAFVLAPIAYLVEWASLLQIFFMLGLYYTTAIVSCALVSMLPAITFALSLILRIECVKDMKSKVGILKVMGTIMCISGGMLLTFYKGPQISNIHSNTKSLHHNDKDNTKDWLLGCLYATIGTTFLSLWMLFEGTLNIKYPCKYTSTCLMSIFASFQCALLSIYKKRDVHDWIIDDRFVIFFIIYARLFSGSASGTIALGPIFLQKFWITSASLKVLEPKNFNVHH